MKIVWFLVFLISTSFADIKLSKSQINVLKEIYSVAKSVDEYPSTIAAISLVESSAGLNIIGDWKKDAGVSLLTASLGCMQIRLDTCRWIIEVTPSLSKYKKIKDQQLAGLLLTNVRFSALIASHYFKKLRASRKRYYLAVSGYNGGYYNKSYYNRVKKAKIIIDQLKRNGVFG